MDTGGGEHRVERRGELRVPVTQQEPQAELRQLRLAAGRDAARAQILTDPGPGDDAPIFTLEQLAQAWRIRD